MSSFGMSVSAFKAGPLRARATGAGVIILVQMLTTGTWAASNMPIVARHVDVERAAAAEAPRSEQDQAIVDGWPLYRTERGQSAFNQAMATLDATNAPPPDASVFLGCEEFDCGLRLPKLTSTGWLPPGRLWVSPHEYILFVRSPRLAEGAAYRRRTRAQMRIFVFHEFHNSTKNTDVFDTVSAHRNRVFTPFYLSKPQRDHEGHHFVMLIQVAPYDVLSRHAFNLGNQGSGIEVAKNADEPLAPLQAKAGVVVAAIVKTASPQIRVVHHRGQEGLGLLRAYQRWETAEKKRVVRLPFRPAEDWRLASAAAHLPELISMPHAMTVTSVGSPSAFDRGKPILVAPPRLVSQGGRREAPAKALTIEALLARDWGQGFKAANARDEIGELIRRAVAP